MKTLSKLLIIAAAIVAAAGCNKENTTKISSGSGYDLTGCTAVYKGSSLSSEVTTTDLTMYETDVQGEYYIPRFFQGDGGLEFSWDKSSNDVRMKESYAGVSSALTALIIRPQEEYEKLLGAEALKSFYDPVTKVFTFNVLIETYNDFDTKSQFTTQLKFTITEEL